MIEAVDELAAVLEAEAAELRHLLAVLREEEHALLRADSAAVAEIVGRKDRLGRDLGVLESRRGVTVARLGAALGAGCQPLTVSALAGLFPDRAARLRSAGRELRGLLTALQALSGRNGFLAERLLDCVRGLLSSLAVALAPTPTYGATGRNDPRRTALRLLDRRA